MLRFFRPFLLLGWISGLHALEEEPEYTRRQALSLSAFGEEEARRIVVMPVAVKLTDGGNSAVHLEQGQDGKFKTERGIDAKGHALPFQPELTPHHFPFEVKLLYGDKLGSGDTWKLYGPPYVMNERDSWAIPAPGHIAFGHPFVIEGKGAPCLYTKDFVPAYAFQGVASRDGLKAILEEEHSREELQNVAICCTDLVSVLCVNKIIGKGFKLDSELCVAILRNKSPEMRSVLAMALLRTNPFQPEEFRLFRNQALKELSFDPLRELERASLRPEREKELRAAIKKE